MWNHDLWFFGCGVWDSHTTPKPSKVFTGLHLDQTRPANALIEAPPTNSKCRARCWQRWAYDYGRSDFIYSFCIKLSTWHDKWYKSVVYGPEYDSKNAPRLIAKNNLSPKWTIGKRYWYRPGQFHIPLFRIINTIYIIHSPSTYFYI